MKTILSLLIFSFFRFYAFSQCQDFSIKINEAERQKLYEFNENLTVDLKVSFNKEKYDHVYIQAIQFIGMRPYFQNIVETELRDTVTIKVPVRFTNSSPLAEEYIVVRISSNKRSSESSFISKNACIDTIRLLSGLSQKDYFWRKGVKISYTAKINNTLINNDLLKVVRSNADSTNKSQIFVTADYLNAEIKVMHNDSTYIFLVVAGINSNLENLEINIFPGSMKVLNDKYGIYTLEQIEKLSDKQRRNLTKMLPEYQMIFDPNVRFKLLKDFKTDHIVIYKMSDHSGTHLIGADSF
jgi:hypothetical protein